MLRYENGNIITGNYPVFCQQVDCTGVINTGLAAKIGKVYPEVYGAYRMVSAYPNKLGHIQTVRTRDGRRCINMFAQNRHDKKYTDYNAFRSCLMSVAREMEQIDHDVPVAFPYGIGCGSAGGDWKIICKMLKELSEIIIQDVVIVHGGR